MFESKMDMVVKEVESEDDLTRRVQNEVQEGILDRMVKQDCEEGRDNPSRRRTRKLWSSVLVDEEVVEDEDYK